MRFEQKFILVALIIGFSMVVSSVIIAIKVPETLEEIEHSGEIKVDDVSYTYENTPFSVFLLALGSIVMLTSIIKIKYSPVNARPEPGTSLSSSEESTKIPALLRVLVGVGIFSSRYNT